MESENEHRNHPDKDIDDFFILSIFHTSSTQISDSSNNTYFHQSRWIQLLQTFPLINNHQFRFPVLHLQYAECVRLKILHLLDWILSWFSDSSLNQIWDIDIGHLASHWYWLEYLTDELAHSNQAFRKAHWSYMS